jgi:hypothetical protein
MSRGNRRCFGRDRGDVGDDGADRWDLLGNERGRGRRGAGPVSGADGLGWPRVGPVGSLPLFFFDSFLIF